MAILIRTVEVVVVVLMGAVTGMVILETLTRGAFDFSLIVTDEFARYFMVWTAMLAAALLVHEEGHIRIGLVPDMLGPRASLVLYVCAQIVVLGFLALMIVSTLIVLPSLSRQNTVTLGVSVVWFYAALPISGALMAFLTLRNLWIRLRPPAKRD